MVSSKVLAQFGIKIDTKSVERVLLVSRGGHTIVAASDSELKKKKGGVAQNYAIRLPDEAMVS